MKRTFLLALAIVIGTAMPTVASEGVPEECVAHLRSMLDAHIATVPAKPNNEAQYISRRSRHGILAIQRMPWSNEEEIVLVRDIYSPGNSVDGAKLYTLLFRNPAPAVPAGVNPHDTLNGTVAVGFNTKKGVYRTQPKLEETASRLSTPPKDYWGLMYLSYAWNARTLLCRTVQDGDAECLAESADRLRVAAIEVCRDNK